jgi:hypothetical protein
VAAIGRLVSTAMLYHYYLALLGWVAMQLMYHRLRCATNIWIDGWDRMGFVWGGQSSPGWKWRRIVYQQKPESKQLVPEILQLPAGLLSYCF